MQGGAGVRHIARVSLELDDLMIHEPHAEVPVEQHHAVAHIVDYGLQCLARVLGVSARQRGLRLRGMQLELLLLDLGDIARRAHHASDAALGVAHRNAVMPRPTPAPVRRSISVFALEALRLTLEVRDQGAPIGLQVVRMDPLVPFLGSGHFIRKAYQPAERR